MGGGIDGGGPEAVEASEHPLALCMTKETTLESYVRRQ